MANTVPGMLDLGFVPPEINGPVHGLAIQPDGKIVIGGSFTQVDNAQRSNLARLNSNGSLDLPFEGLEFGGTNRLIRSVLIRPNGNILIGGAFSSINGAERNGIAQLLPDGRLDTSFVSPFHESSQVSDMALLQNGQLVVVGLFKTNDSFGTAGTFIDRLNPDGSVDLAPQVTLLTPATVNAVAVRGDGKIFTGGTFNYANSPTPASFILSLFRLASTGIPDYGFNPNLLLWRPYGWDFPAAPDFVPSVWRLALQSDGKLLIAGSFNRVMGARRFWLARLLSDDSLDREFNVFPERTSDADLTRVAMAINSVVCQANGKILIGGSFQQIGSTIITNVARLNSNGVVDSTFAPGLGSDADVRCLALQIDGKILVGGDFSSFDGRKRSRIARLQGDPSSAGAPAILAAPINRRVSPGGAAAFNISADGAALRYQWSFNHEIIPGATNDTLLISSVTTANTGVYSVTVSNDLGSVTSPDAMLELVGLAEALDIGGLVWTTGGTDAMEPYSPYWIGQTTVSHDGMDAARSGILLDYSPIAQESWIETTIQGPGILKFWLKGSGSGTVACSVSGQNSVDLHTLLNWTEQEVSIAVGSHTVRLKPTPPVWPVYLDEVSFMPVVGSPPKIVTQPESQSVMAGQSVTFRVAAEGAGAPSKYPYVWKRDGVVIAFTDEGILQRSNITPKDAGSYTVEVSNDFGTDVSEAAMLTVLYPPDVRHQPSNRRVQAGATVQFDVDANGSPDLRFQWSFNDLALRGATNASLVLSNVAFEAAGEYSVKISNDFGVTKTAPATLTIIPALTNHPAAPEFLWAQTLIQGNRTSAKGAIAPDADGGLYFTSGFSGSNRLGAISIRSLGPLDELIARLAPEEGDVLWGKSIGGPAASLDGRDIVRDSSGNLITVGRFIDGASTGYTNLAGSGNYIAKHTPSGDLSWIQTVKQVRSVFEPPLPLTADPRLAVDRNGNTYIYGSFDHTVDFGLTNLSAGFYTYDAFLAKYSSSGELIRVTQAEGPAASQIEDYVTGIAVASSDQVYLAGTSFNSSYYRNSMSPGVVTAGLFLTKVGPDGKLVWKRNAEKQLNDDGSVAPVAIAVDQQDQIIVAGQFQGQAKLGEYQLSGSLLGNRDFFLAKYNSEGTVLWVETGHSPKFASCEYVDVDGTGNSYLLGTFSQEITMGGASFAAETNNVFIAKYDPEGRFVWIKTFEADNWRDSSIKVAYSGEVSIAGTFSGNVALDSLSQSAASPQPDGVQRILVSRLASDQPARKPRLAVHMLNNSVVLEWPSSFSSFVLQLTTNINSGEWVDVPMPSTSTNTTQSISLPVQSERMFFRLNLP